MTGPSRAAATTAAVEPVSEQARQIRGSSLLLFGRVLSLGLGFCIQVLVVRYLPKEEFGAFAYALGLVTFAEAVITLGLDRADSRFIAIYDERRDFARFFGTILLELVTIASIGATLVLLVQGLKGWLGSTLIGDPRAISLLLVLIALSPLQALDRLLMSTFAVLGKPRAIFFRAHVLAPCFRLAVVLLLVLSHSSAMFLAVGYLVTGAAGTALYIGLLIRLLRARGILAHFDRRRLKVPAKALFGFALPLLTTDLVYVVMTTSDVLLLGRYFDTVEVGAFRVIQPLAGLNTVVLYSFTLLYIPLASRLFERGDRAGLQDLYWTTAIWVAVISFPVFVATSVLAGPVTVLMYGERYASSGIYLALLSIGYYFQAALGFNGHTIQVAGRIRYMVAVNVIASVFNAGINLALIPRYGALGAAAGTLCALVVYSLLKQAGLRLGVGVKVFDWRILRVYVVIVVCTAAFLAVEVLLSPPLLVKFALAAVTSLVVLRANRSMLRVGSVFPEIERVPLIRRLIGG